MQTNLSHFVFHILHSFILILSLYFSLWDVLRTEIMPEIVVRLVFSCLQVIADFDATLTKFWVNGTRGQSMLPVYIYFL